MIRIRDAIQFRLIVSIKSSIDNTEACILAAQERFDDATYRIMKAILSSQNNSTSVVHQATASITHQMSNMDVAAQNRHLETLSAIDRLSFHASSATAHTNYTQPDPLLITQRIMQTLNFSEMEDRFISIEPHHEKTFEWVYAAHTNDQANWDDLAEWLRKGRGTYWVSGNAGSGKSTLMKLLDQDPRTETALAEWANNTPMIRLKFFFWSLGESQLHKSTYGLFQSLLYQAIQQAPKLGKTLFPQQYEAGAAWIGFPTQLRVRQAIDRLFSQQTAHVRIFLLLDGLDEFEDAQDQQEDLVELLTRAVKRTNTKAILSSRPYNLFEDYFATSPKLRLHQLTERDISQYVEDKIRQHSRLPTLTTENVQELIAEIVHSAEGVFLWVKLVVRSLSEGLRSGADFEHLQQRLRELPAGLESLLKHMLAKIHRHDAESSSKIFQIIRRHKHIADSNDYSDQWQPILQLTARLVFFAMMDSRSFEIARLNPQGMVNEDDIAAIMKARFRDQCAGLIELEDDRVLRGQPEEPLEEPKYHLLQLGNYEIRYLHKSIAEFISRSDTWATIESKTATIDFNPDVALLQGTLLLLKSLPQDGKVDPWFGIDHMYHGTIFQVVVTAMNFARSADQSTGKAHETLLDELNHEVLARAATYAADHGDHLSEQEMSTLSCIYGTSHFDTDHTNERESMLNLAIRWGLRNYVHAKISNDGLGVLEKDGRPFLHDSIQIGTYSRRTAWRLNPTIAEDLLEAGADPNQECRGYSPWQKLLLVRFVKMKRRRDRRISKLSTPLHPYKWLRLLKSFILAGADVHALSRPRSEGSRRSRYSIRCSALFAVMSHFGLFGDREKRLRKLLDTYDPDISKRDKDAVPKALNEVIALMIERGANLHIYRSPYLFNDDDPVDDHQGLFTEVNWQDWTSCSPARVESIEELIQNGRSTPELIPVVTKPSRMDRIKQTFSLSRSKGSQ